MVSSGLLTISSAFYEIENYCSCKSKQSFKEFLKNKLIRYLTSSQKDSGHNALKQGRCLLPRFSTDHPQYEQVI